MAMARNAISAWYFAGPSSLPSTWSCNSRSALFRRSAAPGRGSISDSLFQPGQFGQQIVVAFDGAQAGQRQIERGLPARGMALTLLQSDDRPADRCYRFPIAGAGFVDRLAGLFRIA